MYEKNMEKKLKVLWYYNTEIIDKIPKYIKFYIDNDYLNEDNFCTFIFDSISDVIEVIQLLYPIATFDIKIDLNYKSAIINNFDNHLYEYKKYRK